jgi:hypothetical protein
MDGTDVVARGEKNTKVWGDGVEVIAVSACGRRAIQAQHAGVTTALSSDGTPSNDFDGTALRGAWELRSSLSPDEQKFPALRPKELKVLATLRCKPKEP